MKRSLSLIVLLLMLSVVLRAQDYKHGISISCGTKLSVTNLYDGFRYYHYEGGDPFYKNNNCIVPCSVEYYLRPFHFWSFGLTGVFSYSECDIRNSGQKGLVSHCTLLAGAKCHWLNSNIVNLFSKLSVGASLCHQNKNMGGESYVLPNFQLSLIGMEVMFTRHFGIFAEAGAGEQGIVHGGVTLHL